LPPPRAATHRVYEDTENWPSTIIPPAPLPKFQAHAISQKTTEATAGNGVAPPRVEGFYDPTAPGAIVMRRPDDEYNGLHNPKGLPVVDVVVMPELGAKLRKHQVEGVKFMYECVMGMKTEGEGCILADDMGLGKTIQSITLIHTLLRQSPYFEKRKGFSTVIQRALIVCPVTLVNNWDKEFHKWLGRDRIKTFKATGTGKDITTRCGSSGYFNVIIIGYEKVSLFALT
jgi:SNF2 family DNA or RNA helicase